jgi:hypothetical protein
LIHADRNLRAEVFNTEAEAILEADEIQPVNPRRTKILAAIRDVLEKDKGIRFVYADKTTGEGVIMKRGK